MAETITLELTRYRPEEETEPTFESFEVPFRQDWVVLDALNYIKDKLDGVESTIRMTVKSDTYHPPFDLKYRRSGLSRRCSGEQGPHPNTKRRQEPPDG